jgi:hypothetical protein
MHSFQAFLCATLNWTETLNWTDTQIQTIFKFGQSLQLPVWQSVGIYHLSKRKIGHTLI